MKGNCVVILCGSRVMLWCRMLRRRLGWRSRGVYKRPHIPQFSKAFFCFRWERKCVHSCGVLAYCRMASVGCSRDHEQALLLAQVKRQAVGVMCVMCDVSHVTRHTSHVTRNRGARHMSHVTRHTSHFTRHTSHVTRHTSLSSARLPAASGDSWCA